jgi:hypothetical protein
VLATASLIARVVLQMPEREARDDNRWRFQAAPLKSQATEAVCACMSSPPMFRTCPFLILAIASNPANVRSAVCGGSGFPDSRIS